MGTGARAILVTGLATLALLGAAWVLARDGGQAERAAVAPAPAARPVAQRSSTDVRPVGGPVSERGTARVEALAQRQVEESSRSNRDGPLEVIVIDELDAPLAGADVRLLGEPRLAPRSSDALGRVEFAADELGDLRERLEDALFPWLGAEKPGYLHAERSSAPRRPGEPVFLRLRRLLPTSGRVTEAERGTPLGGVGVRFVHRIAERASDRLDEACPSCEAIAGVTDAGGNFRLAGVPAGAKVELEASLAGYLTKRSRFRVAAEAEVVTHDLQLRPGLALALTVVDFETGAPLEGALVRGAGTELRTDGLGRVESDQLADADPDRDKLVVSCEGYAELTLRPTARQLLERTALELPLARCTTAAVRVIDSLGRELDQRVWLTWPKTPELSASNAPAWVVERLSSLPKWTMGPEPDGPKAHLFPQADGSLRIEGLPPWLPAFELVATAEDGSTGQVLFPLAEPGGTVAASIALSAASPAIGATVRGRFTVGGVPEPGRVHWRGTERSGSAKVERDGSFSLEGVEPGPVTLSATSERVLARSTCGLPTMAPRELFLRAGDELELDLDLGLAFAPVAGRVTTTSGLPLAGVRVEIADPERCWRERKDTDEDGRFAFEVPTALAGYTVKVERSPEELVQGDVAPGTEGLDFVLSELGRLRFRVVDVELRTPIDRGRIEWRWPGGPLRELADFGRLVPEPDGWYEVDCVSGEIELTASTARDRHQPKRLRGVRVRPGATTEVEFELRESLSPQLVLGEGSIEPPEDFAALIVAESIASKAHFVLEPRPRWAGIGKHGPFDELQFKPDGTARVRGLGPGSYRILVWPETLRIAPERVRLQASEPEPTVRVRLGWR